MSQKIEIYDAEGKVVWKQGDNETVIDPGVAVSMANAMLHAAEACGVDINFEVEKPPVSEMKRLQMVARVNHIMRSMASVKDKNKVAVAIVDSILGTIL
jgi:hypothetical protein